jgi:hypothetical protein
MQGIKKYKVYAEWNENTEIEVTVDFDIKLPEIALKCYGSFPNLIKESSMFWADHPKDDAPLEKHLFYFLKVLANALVWKKAGDNWITKYVIEHISKEEGFFPLDGSWGVTVNDVTSPMDDLSSYDFKVELQ